MSVHPLPPLEQAPSDDPAKALEWMNLYLDHSLRLLLGLTHLLRALRRPTCLEPVREAPSSSPSPPLVLPLPGQFVSWPVMLPLGLELLHAL